MDKLGVITLGLDSQGKYLADFLENLREVSGKEVTVFDYKTLDPTEIAESGVDTLVLSPGVALVGLDTDERFERDPNIRPLYDFIRNSVENDVPLLGINAGHLALNCAYDWAIDNVPEGYKGEQEIDVTGISDHIFDGIDALTMNLTGGYAVLPLKQQKERPLQDRVTPLADHMGRPLISKVNSKLGAPIYGVHPNIQRGTEPFFRNFFQLASQYLETRKG